VYLLACSSGNKARYFSSNIDINNALWFTIKSDLISDINFSNAKSWSEDSVSLFNCFFGGFHKILTNAAKCPILNQVVQLYVQMVLLPDLIGLVVFSVKRKVIKRP
jgi:hypothetical protein